MTTSNLWWLSLQPDWREGFDHKEKVWVSAHHVDHKTRHSFLSCNGPTDQIFSSKLISERLVEVTHTESNTTTKFLSPSSSHKVTTGRPLSLDITDSGGLGVVTDGKDVVVFEGLSGAVRRTMSGHASEVEKVKFFPSNKVVLSGGSDMCLRIWSIEDGSCPVTIPAHKRCLTGLAMVGRGKEIISSSADGTIKIWNCGTQECLNTFNLPGGVNDIHLEDRMLLSVTDTGAMAVHNIQDSSSVFTYKHSCELTACTALSQYVSIVGSKAGEMLMFDLRSPAEPLSQYKRSNYSITCLRPDTNMNRLWCSQTDGECYLLSSQSGVVTSSSDSVTSPADSVTSPADSVTSRPDSVTSSSLSCDVTLSGADCEAVYCVVAKGGQVFTAAKDRVVRRYEM